MLFQQVEVALDILVEAVYVGLYVLFGQSELFPGVLVERRERAGDALEARIALFPVVLAFLGVMNWLVLVEPTDFAFLAVDQSYPYLRVLDAPIDLGLGSLIGTLSLAHHQVDGMMMCAKCLVRVPFEPIALVLDEPVLAAFAFAAIHGQVVTRVSSPSTLHGTVNATTVAPCLTRHRSGAFLRRKCEQTSDASNFSNGWSPQCR